MYSSFPNFYGFTSIQRLNSLGPLFERFSKKSGPRGTRQKKVQNLDSLNQGRKNENYVLSTFRHLRISYRLLFVQV